MSAFAASKAVLTSALSCAMGSRLTFPSPACVILSPISLALSPMLSDSNGWEALSMKNALSASERFLTGSSFAISAL